MTTQNDEIAIVLANRRYLYELFQHIFSHEPSIELLEILIGEHTQEALELLIADENDNHESQPQIDAYKAYLTLVADLKQAIDRDPEGTLEKLISEYTYLMIGPNKLPAPPWESVYLTKERLIFQQSTLEVRQKYLKYHFLPANYPHEADDHISFELDFMGRLAKSTMECFDNGNVVEIKNLLSDQKAFLEEHLLVWIGDFAKEIQRSKTHYFYPQIAVLIHEFLKIDKDIVDEVMYLLN